MSEIKKILKCITVNQRFIITSHHNPDADAIGSSLAMAIFLKSLGKTVSVVNEDSVPEWLTFLPQAKLCKKAGMVKKIKYDVAIIVDCGDRERIGGVEKLLVEGKTIINIDHHISNDSFADINLICAKASSTCEILFELFQAARFRMTKPAAHLLYAGMMTDTGSFRYENTSARVHAIAAQLMAFGIKAQDMYERLYVGIPVKDMKLFAKVIHEAELLLKDRVYCVSLTKKLNTSFSKSFDLKEKLFTFLRSVKGVDVVVILTEVNSKETRVNLRSQGNFNVAALAMKFNGGGHIKAAGAKVFDGLVPARNQIMSAIAKQIKG